MMNIIFILFFSLLLLVGCGKKGSSPGQNESTDSSCIFSKISDSELKEISHSLKEVLVDVDPNRSCSERVHLFLGVTVAEKLAKKIDQNEFKKALVNNEFSKFLLFNLKDDSCQIKQNVDVSKIKTCKWEE